MPHPQPGILPEPNQSALFLILRVLDPAGHISAVAELASEAGLFFIAYTKNMDIPEKMLGRMMGTSGDGLHDHLM